MSEWISVEDRLPPYDIEVLVYQPNWKGQLVTAAIFLAIDSSGHKFIFNYKLANYNNLIDPGDSRYSVTHWMPLPEPPE